MLILVIDDEDDLREMVVEELVDAGYETLEACDGEDGLQAILTGKPDLVLCDVTMPRMNGYELLKKVRNDYPGLEDLPFVYLSALADRGDVVTGLNFGADDYITKPIDFGMLLTKVEARLRQVERIKDKKNREMVRLYKALNPDDDGAKTAAPSMNEAAAPVGRKPDTRDERVRAVMDRNSGRFVAGRFQMIGLDSIKQQMGSGWERRVAMVADTVRKVIHKHLAPEDVVREGADGDFVVCFAQLSEQEAAFKANAIREEIWEWLFGSTEHADLYELRTEVREVEASVEEASTYPDLMDLVAARLAQGAERSKALAAKIQAELIQTSRLDLCPLGTSAGKRTPAMVAKLDADSGAKAVRLMAAGANPADVRAELDSLVFGLASEHILSSITSDAEKIIIPVDFSTIHSKRWREKYRALCAHATEFARRATIFDVRNCPTTLPTSDMTVAMLAPFSRARMIHLSQADLGQIDLRLWQIAFVAVDQRILTAALRRNAAKLQTFVDAVHNGKARLAADCAGTALQPEIARVGIDYIIA